MNSATNLFFDSWQGLGRVLLLGVPTYVALVLVLRISGKRTLTKLNAFDFVVTVALGSTLATVLLSKDVALAEGIVALGLLVLLQYAITWGSVRWPWFSHLVKSEPTLLIDQGTFIDKAMREQRVTHAELLSVLRKEGLRNVADAAAVILETDGSFSVVSVNPTHRNGARGEAKNGVLENDQFTLKRALATNGTHDRSIKEKPSVKLNS